MSMFNDKFFRDRMLESMGSRSLSLSPANAKVYLYPVIDQDEHWLTKFLRSIIGLEGTPSIVLDFDCVLHAGQVRFSAEATTAGTGDGYALEMSGAIVAFGRLSPSVTFEPGTTVQTILNIFG